MLEPLVALMISAGPHGPVDSVLQEDASIESLAPDVNDKSASEPEYAAATKYVPATGVIIDADQVQRLYLPYD